MERYSDYMNILFTICARAGSKGVTSKNIREFCGRPLVYYTLRAYEKYVAMCMGKKHEIELAVNTDSPILLEQIDNYKRIKYVYIRRKDELAGDSVAKGEVIKDTLIETEKMTNKKFEIAVDLDLTSPLRNVSDIEGTINQVIKNEECNFAYSVVESRRNPYFNMVCKKDNGFYDRIISSNYTARQQVPKCFDMNASIYVYAREYLMDMRIENRCAGIWKMEDTAVLDIDSEADFRLMEIIAEYYWKQGKYLDII